MINIDDDPKEIVKELSETEKNIWDCPLINFFVKLKLHLDVVIFFWC